MTITRHGKTTLYLSVEPGGMKLSNHLGQSVGGALMEQNLRGQAMMGHPPLPSMPSSNYYGTSSHHHQPHAHSHNDPQALFVRHVQK